MVPHHMGGVLFDCSDFRDHTMEGTLSECKPVGLCKLGHRRDTYHFL
jgi:hypothetical protein